MKELTKEKVFILFLLLQKGSNKSKPYLTTIGTDYAITISSQILSWNSVIMNILHWCKENESERVRFYTIEVGPTTTMDAMLYNSQVLTD